MRDSGRPTLVGAVLGVLLLGALVVFAVVVPQLDDSPATSDEAAEATELEPVELPDALPLELVAVDSGDLGPEVNVDGLAEQESSVTDRLEEIFDAPAAFRIYGTAAGDALVQVTVLDREPGLFAPEALPVDPALLGLTRAQVELQRIEEAVCSVNYGQPVPQGQPVDPAAEPQTIRCQRGEPGRTYEISAQGLTIEETSQVLDALVDG